MFDDGARSKVQTVAREIYDESPAMQNAQMCLSWRPQTKKKEDPAGFVAELTNHIKSQKETLKQLLQHKDEMTSRCQDIERDYKTNVIEATANAPKHTIREPATAEELAEVKAEREKLARDKEAHMMHLKKVEEAEEALQKSIESVNEERAKIREEVHQQVVEEPQCVYASQQLA